MIRRARIADVKQIYHLVEFYANRGEMLPRSYSDLYDNLRDFYVYHENDEVIGISALHICWEDLAEIRTLAVAESHIRKGIGANLVNICISEAKELGIRKVFALTYKADFFRKFGFLETDKSSLPHKIWGDCIKCVKFPNCDESAMVIQL